MMMKNYLCPDFPDSGRVSCQFLFALPAYCTKYMCFVIVTVMLGAENF